MGERVVVLDNTGWEYEITLTDLSREEAVGEVVQRRRCSGEPAVSITLYQCVLKGTSLTSCSRSVRSSGSQPSFPSIPSEPSPKRAKVVPGRAAKIGGGRYSLRLRSSRAAG